jgi:Nuclease-related domain
VAERASLRVQVGVLGSIPPARRRWRRTLRAGLFWTALGLGAASISYTLTLDMAARSLGFDRRLAELFFALIPIPPLALGVHGLALALRLRAASALADRTAAYLSDHLPDGYVVVPHYGPRDGAEDEVPMVVVGPPGVVVIEPRDEGGEVVCYEDHWYRKQKYGVGRRFSGQSPSQRARWNAARVSGDIGVDPAPTPVEALVVFTSAHLAGVSSSSVPALEGLPAIVDRLVGAPRTPVRVAV